MHIPEAHLLVDDPENQHTVCIRSIDHAVLFDREGASAAEDRLFDTELWVDGEVITCLLERAPVPVRLSGAPLILGVADDQQEIPSGRRAVGLNVGRAVAAGYGRR